ncbi:hypothetical protein HPB49_005492 [Dermacentor silvarum]|uniref:Uncharacterized protein n=1 Tax=Dermacentor silvarum TaxID=543639 RepID=A0ACB8DNP6_DERSI|nr:hypothetical protein HPB49_005492 [Dermacentor silvarum]
MRTDWTRRVYHIEKKYGFFGEKIEADTAAKWSIEVRQRVKEAETTIWSKEMESKSTLELYRGNKRGISGECFYDNSIGSSLLFEARAGALRTLVYRSRFQDTDCSGRGRRSPLGHSVFNCSRQRMETTSRMATTSAGPALYVAPKKRLD